MSLVKDIALTADGSDLDLTDNTLTLIEGVQRVTQNLLIRLRAFRGEWYLDRNFGLPFYEKILVKNPDGGLIRSLFKAVIIGTEDVLELTRFEAEFDSSTRQLSITFTCETAFGTVSGEV